jgi:RHS repeat-associated protein
VSDKKLAVASTTDPNLIAYYNADVVTANDYYPFGSQMPGRKFSQANSSYRYGFNGQEKSEENCGCGDTYTAQFWEYDSRTGRRYNVDPVEDIGISPYATNRNNPILYTDPKGDCPFCPFLAGMIAGAIAEMAEQTISIAVDNLQNGRPMFEGLGKKMDFGDVLVSSIQGGLMTLPGVGVGAEVISEVAGNYIKSAFDASGEKGFVNVFDNSKSQSDFEKDFVTNSMGSVAGAAPVAKVVTTTATKVTAKAVIKTTAKAVASGVRTGAYETATGMIIDEATKSKSKSNSNASSNSKSKNNNSTKTPTAKTTSTKSTKTDWKSILVRTLNGKPVPTNSTQPYDNEVFKKVPVSKK